MDTLTLAHQGDTLILQVHVTPRSSRSAVLGVYGGRLKVALDAPPVDGAANAALITLLAKLLKIPQRQIELVRGQTSRQKTVSLAGVEEAAVRALVPD